MHGDARCQILVEERVVAVGGFCTVKVATGSRSSSTSNSCGRSSRNPLTVLADRERAEPDDVLAVLGKRIRPRHATARANRHPGQ